MIKNLVMMIFVTALGSRGFGASFEVSDRIAQLCSGYEQVVENMISCRNAKDFAAVTAAKIGKKYSGTALELIEENSPDSVFDLGVTGDDGANTIYSYVNILIKKGTTKKVGYITVEGIVNDEAETRVRVTKRFNLDGKFVSAEVIDF